MEIALLDLAILQRDFSIKCRGQPKQDTALDLVLHDTGVNDLAAVHRTGDLVYPDRTILDSGFHHLGKVRSETPEQGEPPSTPFWPWA